MSNFEKHILETDYRKIVRLFIIAALCVIVLGGILVGFTWRTQIGEAIAFHQTIENSGNTDNQNLKLTNERSAIDNESKNKDEQAARDNAYKNEPEDGQEHDDADIFDSTQFTQPTVGAQIAFWTAAVLCMLLGIAYWLLIMAWLYKAAEQSAMNSALWAIAGLFGNLIAVFTFLIVRGFRPGCPNCGRHQEKASYCRFCGTALYHICQGCGLPFRTKDAFCPYCGHPSDIPKQ